MNGRGGSWPICGRRLSRAGSSAIFGGLSGVRAGRRSGTMEEPTLPVDFFKQQSWVFEDFHSLQEIGKGK